MGSEFYNKFILSVFKNFFTNFNRSTSDFFNILFSSNWAKPKVSENRPVNVKERARQNIEQKGISNGCSQKKR